MLERFSYTTVHNAGYTAIRPLLPITLIFRQQTYSAIGLLDSGADINVLPFNMGLMLGADWKAQTTAVTGLSGNLANYEARGIVIQGIVGNLPPIRLAFAWTLAENVPLIFWQTNFFAQFNVCFFQSQNVFEVVLKGELPGINR